MDNINAYAEQYMEKIFYFCLKRTGNVDDAEDLTSDISLNILKQLKNEVYPENFSAYVWQIARNRYSRWADDKHKKSQLFSNGDISDFPIQAEDDVENEYVRGEELSLLRRELAFISSEYRNIVVAFYIENHSVNQIAKKFGLTDGAVKMRLSRVRNILKEGMSMARVFGKKSYNPENIEFAASGRQPTGLPWGAVQRKVPKNILIQADNNPSTIEELAMELGISAPYMEEEVMLLEKATLLKRVGNKYLTNFFIVSKECQTQTYEILKRHLKGMSDLISGIADDALGDIKTLNASRNGMSDNGIKWFLCIYIADLIQYSLVDKSQIYNPEKRENGESWGFIGYEVYEGFKNFQMGCNGSGNGETMFWSYKINEYGMWDRAGEMSYSQTMLFADIISKGRNVNSLTESEKRIWDSIDGRFAHVDKKGNVIPDILVFTNGVKEQIDESIKNHNLFEKALSVAKSAFDGIISVLKEESNEILKKQLIYSASMEMNKLRAMTVHELVSGGKLVVPENPKKSTAAMWIEIC